MAALLHDDSSDWSAVAFLLKQRIQIAISISAGTAACRALAWSVVNLVLILSITRSCYSAAAGVRRSSLTAHGGVAPV
jgi:hypothetical protein